jgi:hypothetical protein
MKKLIVDRLEKTFAVCEQEDKNMVHILTEDLPKGVAEGNVIVINDNGTIQIDIEHTVQRKENMKKLMNELFEE